MRTPHKIVMRREIGFRSCRIDFRKMSEGNTWSFLVVGDHIATEEGNITYDRLYELAKEKLDSWANIIVNRAARNVQC